MPTRKNQKIEKERTGADVLRMTPDRDMVGSYVNDLEARFTAEMSLAGKQSVILDLSSVRHIDSRGLALCIGLSRECTARGSGFSILAGTDLYRFFRVLKLTNVIDIREGTSA